MAIRLHSRGSEVVSVGVEGVWLWCRLAAGL
jgi:hypothetical protein